MILRNSCLMEPFHFEAQFNHHTVFYLPYFKFVLLLKFEQLGFSVYSPKKTDINSLQDLDSSLFRLGDRLNTSNVIVAGDFNAPDLKWNYLEPINCSLNSERLLEIINEHGRT